MWPPLELCGISKRTGSLTSTSVWRNGLLACGNVLFDNQKGKQKIPPHPFPHAKMQIWNPLGMPFQGGSKADEEARACSNRPQKLRHILENDLAPFSPTEQLREKGKGCVWYVCMGMCGVYGVCVCYGPVCMGRGSVWSLCLCAWCGVYVWVCCLCIWYVMLYMCVGMCGIHIHVCACVYTRTLEETKWARVHRFNGPTMCQLQAGSLEWGLGISPLSWEPWFQGVVFPSVTGQPCSLPLTKPLWDQDCGHFYLTAGKAGARAADDRAPQHNSRAPAGPMAKPILRTAIITTANFYGVFCRHGYLRMCSNSLMRYSHRANEWTGPGAQSQSVGDLGFGSRRSCSRAHAPSWLSLFAPPR